MKTFRFLLEGQKDTVVTSFMRANPPTAGHARVVGMVTSLAKKYNAFHDIRLSHSQDSKKNPLTPEQKLKHSRRMFPHANFSTSSPTSPSYLTHAAELHKKGFKHLIMVAGSDRAKDYEKTLHKYNGKFDAKGNGYHFDSIKVVSAGHRNPNATGVEGISASKMRSYASAGDYKSFQHGVTKYPEKYTKDLYHDVRHGMKLAEEIEHELYVFGEILNKGEIVEDLISGEKCPIEFRGDNYVTILRENGDLEKRFVKDVTPLEEGYFRYHRSMKLGPVSLNINKKSDTLSIGKNSMFGVTLGSNRETTHIKTPFKGLSYRSVKKPPKEKDDEFALPKLRENNMNKQLNFSTWRESSMRAKGADFDYANSDKPSSNEKNPDGTLRSFKNTKPNKKPIEYTGSGSKTYRNDFWKKMKEDFNLDEAKQPQLKGDVTTLEKSFHKIDSLTGLEVHNKSRHALSLVRNGKGFTLNHIRGSKIRKSWEYDSKGQRINHTFMEGILLDEYLLDEGLARAAMKILQKGTLFHKTEPKIYHKYSQAATHILSGHHKDLEDFAQKEGRSIRTFIMTSLHTQGGQEGKELAKRLGFQAEENTMKTFKDFDKPDVTVPTSEDLGEATPNVEAETAVFVHNGIEYSIDGENRVEEMESLKSILESESTDPIAKPALSVFAESVSRKHFQMVADALKAIPEEKKRTEMAVHHAKLFAKQNPAFNHEKFFNAANVAVDHFEGSVAKPHLTVVKEAAIHINPAEGFLDALARGKKENDIRLQANKGKLHKTLGVPEGDKLTSGEIDKAKHSDNPLTRKRANFAANAKKWHHEGTEMMNEDPLDWEVGQTKDKQNALLAKHNGERVAIVTGPTSIHPYVAHIGKMSVSYPWSDIQKVKDHVESLCKGSKKLSAESFENTDLERLEDITKPLSETKRIAYKAYMREKMDEAKARKVPGNYRFFGKIGPFPQLADKKKAQEKLSAGQKAMNLPTSLLAKKTTKEDYEQQPAIPGTFDAPESEFDSEPGYVVGAWDINGKIVKLVRMGNILAPIKVVVDHDEWKDVDGIGMRFLGKQAALDAYHAAQSGEGRHNERQEVPMQGPDDNAAERVGASESVKPSKKKIQHTGWPFVGPGELPKPFKKKKQKVTIFTK